MALCASDTAEGALAGRYSRNLSFIALERGKISDQRCGGRPLCRAGNIPLGLLPLNIKGRPLSRCVIQRRGSNAANLTKHKGALGGGSPFAPR